MFSSMQFPLVDKLSTCALNIVLRCFFSFSLTQEEVGLLRAARAGNLEKVKNYLNQNVDINVTNSVS